eukprot:306746-Chlamydomonas_euryale.AAC.1
MLAACVAASRASDVPDLMQRLGVSPKASFEVGHNHATALVALGDFAAAETQLRMAVKQGRESLFEEDCTEDEVRRMVESLSGKGGVGGMAGHACDMQVKGGRRVEGHAEQSDESASLRTAQRTSCAGRLGSFF